MKTYLILYQWYEYTVNGIIEANNEDEALLKFAEYSNKLDCNYMLEKKYGYGGSLNLYFDKEGEKSFKEVFQEYLNNGNRDLFNIIELTGNTKGIITNKGFYNGEEE